MGIQINPSRNLTATGGIAIKNVGHAHCTPQVQLAIEDELERVKVEYGIFLSNIGSTNAKT
jgi:hypothetical protein